MTTYVDATGFNLIAIKERAALLQWVTDHGITPTQCVSAEVDGDEAVFTVLVRRPLLRPMPGLHVQRSGPKGNPSGHIR